MHTLQINPPIGSRLQFVRVRPMRLNLLKSRCCVFLVEWWVDHVTISVRPGMFGIPLLTF